MARTADPAEPVPSTAEPDAAEPGPPAAPSRFRRARERAVALAELSKARGTAVYEHLQARRQDSPRVDAVFRVVEQDKRVAGAILSGALAFRVFLFFVPLVFVLVSGLGFLTNAIGGSPTDAARSAGAAGLLAQTVAQTANSSLFERLAALLVGLFALYLTAGAALKVLRAVHGLVWGVPVPKAERPARDTLMFIGVTIGALLLVRLLGALITSSGQGQILGPVLMGAVVTALWVSLSLRAFPHADGAGRRALLPGSVVVGIGAALLHTFTVVWIARLVSSKSETYGAIGAALALLLWAYVLGRIMLAGATVNAALWNRDHSDRASRATAETEPTDVHPAE